ncbi:hypothetical protein B0T17DRAFT_488392 [Bombardia bombarda]|uniref:Co-chaperone HscB C-terminal oligomerisation domain-containing protein n=1 Tax=Bombardia bombarda TaxID=252184 RepID=A0AA39X6X4_9PEZI|nr:hypothetical protein B0T17DRAFT_488392 [Bombardia bombarda]
MRASIIFNSPARAASRLCATCRKEATSTTRGFATVSAATGVSISNSRPATTSQKAQRIASSSSSSSPLPTAATRRWLPIPATTATATPQNPRYYALFPETLPAGAPPSGPFHIDVRALRREFLRLQAAAHPDFHHSASGHSDTKTAARRQAETTSALINSAYKTLSSPLLRAQYLLHELHGVDLAGDEAGSETAADAEVLMTVLEAREAIEEAQREEDLVGLRAENEERIEAAERAIEDGFGRGDVEAVKGEAVRLRYWMNIRESVDNWERGKPVVLQH